MVGHLEGVLMASLEEQSNGKEGQEALKLILFIIYACYIFYTLSLLRKLA